MNAVIKPRRAAALPRSETSHHAGKSLRADEPAEGGSHVGCEGHVGVPSAEHHHADAGGGYGVRVETQAPPDAERVDNAHSGSGRHQPFDHALGGVGFAGAGGADDRQALLQHGNRQDSHDPLGHCLACVRRFAVSCRLGVRAASGKDTAYGGLAHPVAPGHLGGRMLSRQYRRHNRGLLVTRQLRAAPTSAAEGWWRMRSGARR